MNLTDNDRKSKQWLASRSQPLIMSLILGYEKLHGFFASPNSISHKTGSMTTNQTAAFEKQASHTYSG